MEKSYSSLKVNPIKHHDSSDEEEEEKVIEKKKIVEMQEMKSKNK
jgi:hypothetical protein